jgi:hypothetical protein
VQPEGRPPPELPTAYWFPAGAPRFFFATSMAFFSFFLKKHYITASSNCETGANGNAET